VVNAETSDFNRINHVTIVGGGTAGWLTAMLLSTSLNVRSDAPKVRVTLIESPNIPTVGVGEATVPGMPRLLNQLGIDEKQLFLRCNASFKLGVRFVGWNQDDDGNPLEYIHPFNSPPAIAGLSPAYHFHRYVPESETHKFSDAMVPNGDMIRALRGPRMTEDEDYHYKIGYAYHLDAALFALFMREVGVSRGVEHILDDVVDVKQGENGYVTALQLKERGIVPVQLVVDCTGFQSLVIGKVLDEPFDSFSDLLLCDSALAVQIPHEDPTQIEPCTRSTALGAGWCWHVPLYSRLGTGYVFSSRFRSDDEAVDEFKAYLGDKGKDVEPRLIRMRIGRRRRGWVKNRVAIGLSSGFIEPLESTPIYMIETAARWLVRHFPDRSINPALANNYNRLMEALSEEIRDFIVTHYYTSNRQDPFWVAARSEIELPDRLRERLELWRYTMPSVVDTSGDRFFNYWNYLCVLYSKGYFRDASYPLEGSISKTDWDQFLQRLVQTKQHLIQNLPGHYELVCAIREAAQQSAHQHVVPPAIAAAAGSFHSTVPLPDWGHEASDTRGTAKVG
jgi:tryptophan halogenase